MPSNQNPLGALPVRFRRPRLLIVGCGDVGLRAVRALHAHAANGHGPRVLALTSSAGRVAALRSADVTPLVGNLDQPGSLARLAGLATCVLYLAPPPGEKELGPAWWLDPRSSALARVLRRRTLPRALVYASTSGVYGDCAGAWVAESRPLAPTTPRAQRRANAEASMRQLGRAGVRVSLLRVPGIYAPDREGGTPHARLQRGTPVLVADEDVYTNHIHADDLARACLAALWRGRAQRAYNVNDDSDLRMGDYFDVAADLYGMARPRRVTRAQALQVLSPTLLSFMRESRRLVNLRMKRELRLRLHYPTVQQGLVGQRG